MISQNCDICGKTCSYKSTTTNLRKHIERKHPTINLKEGKLLRFTESNDPDDSEPNQIREAAEASTSAEVLAPAEPEASTSTSEPTHKHSSRRQTDITTYIHKKVTSTQKKTIDRHAMGLFTYDFQPFSVVEDIGFVRFVKALNPSYQLPSRKAISNAMLPAAYEQCLNSVKQKLSGVESVSLTTDCWTSSANECYMAITLHYLTDNFQLQSSLLGCASLNVTHTSKNLASEIKRETDIFNLSDKVLVAVTDNAANIRSAVISELKWRHLGCFAHTLNLIVQDALNIIQSLHEKVKIVVSHFKRSAGATQKLLKFQRDSGVESPKKLIQDMPTRWNSTLYMFDRLSLLQDAVRATVALSNADLPVISAEEWRICAEVSTALKPFEEVSRKLSAENYITASQVIVVVAGLATVCNKLVKENFHPTVVNLILQLRQGVDKRFQNMERSKTLGLCTFLDPRFKLVAFVNPQAAESIKTFATELVTKEFNQQRSSQAEEREVTASNISHTEKFSVWEGFDSLVATSQPRGTALSGAIVEVQRYLEEQLLPRNQDPLIWWNKYKHIYPTLARIVKKRFNVVATSVPCERIFSKTGTIVSDRRTRLSSQKVEQLIFLNANSNE